MHSDSSKMPPRLRLFEDIRTLEKAREAALPIMKANQEKDNRLLTERKQQLIAESRRLSSERDKLTGVFAKKKREEINQYLGRINSELQQLIREGI